MQQKLYLLIALLTFTTLSCQGLSGAANTVTPTPLPTDTPTPLPPIPVEPGSTNPDEPVFITGEIPYTSPFFINSISQPFVMLEDQAGFIQRNREYTFPLSGQVIGPVEIHDDESLTYYLSLPAIPQGSMNDVDNNGQRDPGVQVFAIAYWSNTWGDPFLEERDGHGWSNAYASTLADPNQDNEITGGVLLVWAPDDEQGFPTAFGTDGLLFTEDDPAASIPAGYNLVDLNQEPFNFYKEAQPNITLTEGIVAVNDYSQMDYGEAFSLLFEKASREYPFTNDKGVDWQDLRSRFEPRAAGAENDDDFYRALRDFSFAIPDGHVNVSINSQIFYEEQGGGFGLVLAELDDGRVIVTQVIEETPGEQAGIEAGAEIISWNGEPVSAAISEVTPYFGPYSTEHAQRIGQLQFLPRVPPDAQIEITFKNPGEAQVQEKTLKAEVEYDSLRKTIPSINLDELALPIEGYVMNGTGLGYVRISTFSDDYHLMAQLWDHYLESLIAGEIPGLIIDVRTNSGGSTGMATNFAGYFFDEEMILHHRLYYNEDTGKFKDSGYPTRIQPAPIHYDGEIAVLVGPNCISACEGFVYAMSQGDHSTIIGYYPTAGAFGEVGRGQYKLPGDIDMQFPTGKPETPDGKLLIEGTGIIPDIIVPVTEESVFDQSDTLVETAIQTLLDLID